LITARDGRPPWSTKASVHTVREIEPDNIVSSRIMAEEFYDKCLRDWLNWAFKTCEEATESYMVEVTAESHSSSSNPVLVGSQHVRYYDETRRSGTA